MWPFERKETARRREIRRRAEQRLPWYQRLVGRVGAWPLGIALAFGVGSAIILSTGETAMPWRTGMYVAHGINARVDFAVPEDIQATRFRRQQARDSSPNFYKTDPLLLEEIRGRLSNLIRLGKMYAGDSVRMRQEADKAGFSLDDAAIAELDRLIDRQNSENAEPQSLEEVQPAGVAATSEFDRMVERSLQNVAAFPLVEVHELATRRTSSEARLAHGPAERIYPAAALIFATPEDAEAKARRAADEAARAFPEALRPAVRGTVSDALLAGKTDGALRPLHRYDTERTQLIAENAADAIQPLYQSYKRNDPLVDPGVIDSRELNLLALERQAYAAATQTDAELAWAAVLERAGRSALAFLIAAGVATYVSRARIRARKNPRRLAAVAAILLAMLAASRLIFVSTPAVPPQFAAGAQAFAAAIMTLLYPQRFALGACGALALLICLAAGSAVGFLVTLLSVSAVSIVGLGDIRRRGKIVAVGMVGAVAAFATTYAAALVENQTVSFAAWQSLWAAGMTLAAGFVVEGSLPFIERFFRLSTNMTLLEWCDANKPLLRVLASRAPGTYNHSLLVGAMAEAAADAIGANGLLARAGAYYHDIGKINKPDYFIENQPPGASRHENLSPAMSLLVIISHVKDGIEMAREYKLPAALHPFIAEHHGTTLVEYFYHAANRERGPDDPEVADTQFRYPGPRPQSRETAIVMLCDGVEGAVRTLPEPTPGRIEAVVSEMIRKRLLDDQLNECDLTFRDLGLIEQSLIKTLAGIYHGRIAYPTADAKSA